MPLVTVLLHDVQRDDLAKTAAAANDIPPLPDIYYIIVGGGFPSSRCHGHAPPLNSLASPLPRVGIDSRPRSCPDDPVPHSE